VHLKNNGNVEEITNIRAIRVKIQISFACRCHPWSV